MADYYSPKKPVFCSFCGRSSEVVQTMVAGPDVYICDICVNSSVDIIRDEKRSRSRQAIRRTTPSEIFKELDKYVIQQNHAKKVLSVGVYNHYKRIEQMEGSREVELEKSNILLLGPTGTGKTLLARTLARHLNVPFTIVDATILTEAGYVGEDVENILVRLLQAADYDLEKTQRGIIYVDEIDKVARKDANASITRDVSGEGVQQALLKILEGTVSSVPPKGGRKHPEQNLINVDTTGILFICGGAFDGLEKIIERRIGKKGMGFGAQVKSNEERIGRLLEQTEPVDLVHYGLIPELVGRLPIIAGLEELDHPAMLNILTQPKNAIVKQYEKMFEMDGCKLEFSDDALDEIVKLAMVRKTGARALRAVMEKVMLEVMYDLPEVGGKSSCVITREIVLGDASATFKKIPARKSA